MKDIKTSETVIHTKLMPNNQTSTALDDLLVSRTVSEGGYDSDARGIRTPSWTRAGAGSILVSPEYTAKVLNAFELSPSKGSASLPQTPRNERGNDHSPVALTCTPSRATGQAAAEEIQKIQQDGIQSRVRATSTPRTPATPQRESFSALLQLRPQESPSDVLRRLSVGLANGTIKLPDTPELKAMRMPSIVGATPEWRLSFAAPRRASSLHRGDQEVRLALKTLSGRVEKAKRDSTASGWTSTDKHVSLLSNLDPALLHYISRYGDDEHNNRLDETKGPVDENAKDGEVIKDAPHLGATSTADTSGIRGSPSAQAGHAEHKTNASSQEDHSQHEGKGLEHEKESVHLFDMRISQRLASNSVLPTTTPSSTDLGSTQHHRDKSSQSTGKLDNLPTFIGRTSTEHLRRPSDPRTRRLFEGDGPAHGRKLHPKWKSAVSASGLSPEKPSHRAEVSRDDASSVYMSDAGLEESDVKSIVSHRARPHSRRISNSLAVAGRQGMLSVPSDRRRNSMSQTLSTDHQSNFGATRKISDVRGKESKFSEDFDSQRKSVRDKLQSEGADTLANESMSMVDFLTMSDPAGAGKEMRVEIEDRNARRDKDTAEASISNVPSIRNDMSASRPGNVISTDAPIRTTQRGRDECATNMWERALRTAREDPHLGSSGQSFGSSFGQLRLEQSRSRCLSDNRPPHEHVMDDINGTPPRRSRSLSPNISASARPLRESFDLDRHQSLCVEAKKPLTRPTSPARSIKTKKRSLIDLGRFATLGHQNNNHNIAKSSPATDTSTRDFLSWARFPSYNCLERNGSATDKDGVLTRDFSPPADTEMPSGRNRSKLSLMTQPDNMGVHTPSSWRFLKVGHARKKSRSMDFAVSDPGQIKADKETEKKKASALTLSLSRWTRLYRSHSSDLRRFRAGHRSSVSKGGKVEYPELEIVPGYDGANGGRSKMEELGDYEEEQRRWLKEKERGRSKGGLHSLPAAMKNGDLVKRRTMAPEVTAEEASDGLERWSARGSSSLSEKREDRTPTKNQHQYRHRASPAGGNAWADIYQACVVKAAEDDHDHDHGYDYDARPDHPPIGSSARLLASTDSITPTTHRQASSGSHDEQGSSYISCSVALSDHLLPSPPRLTSTRDMDGACELAHHDDDELLGRSNDGAEDAGNTAKKRARLMLSSELRESTVDFRMRLVEEERRVREGLVGRGEEGGWGGVVVS